MPKTPPPSSRRLTRRFGSVLGAVMDILDEFQFHRTEDGVPLDRTRREEVVRLLDTAEAAVARELGRGWRIHWTDDQMVVQRDARVALLMAFTALLMVLRREQDRAPAVVAPKRKPRRRVVTGTEPFGPFLPMPFMPEPPTPPIRPPDEPREQLPKPAPWHIPSKSFLTRIESPPRGMGSDGAASPDGETPAGRPPLPLEGRGRGWGSIGRNTNLSQTYPRVRNP